MAYSKEMNSLNKYTTLADFKAHHLVRELVGNGPLADLYVNCSRPGTSADGIDKVVAILQAIAADLATLTP